MKFSSDFVIHVRVWPKYQLNLAWPFPQEFLLQNFVNWLIYFSNEFNFQDTNINIAYEKKWLIHTFEKPKRKVINRPYYGFHNNKINTEFNFSWIIHFKACNSCSLPKTSWYERNYINIVCSQSSTIHCYWSEALWNWTLRSAIYSKASAVHLCTHWIHC